MKDCQSNPYDWNCMCYDSLGSVKSQFRQYNKSTQKFHCCNNLDVSPPELKKYLDYHLGATGTCTKEFSIPNDYYNTIKAYKGTCLSNIGCSYGYDDNYNFSNMNSQNDFKDLYNNIRLDAVLYTKYFSQHKPPIGEDYTVTCTGSPGSDLIPAILQWNYLNNSDIYTNTLTFCSDKTAGTISEPVTIPGYSNININTFNYYDENNNPVNTFSSDRLKNKDYYNIESFMNNQPSFENSPNKQITSFIIIGSVCIVISLLLSLYLYYLNSKKLEKKII